MIPKQYALIAGVSFLVGAAGVGVGHILTKRSLGTKYDQRLEIEIAEAKHFYELMAKKEIDKNKALQKKDLRTYVDKASAYDEPGDAGLERALEFDPEGEPVDGHHDDWDQEAEEKSRTEDVPYVINRNEFVHEKQEFDKICLTYYEKDDVVFDDRTSPLVDVDTLIGDENLKRFGEGSGKKDVVFVRNEHLETDWEITRSQGDYVEEVLGGIRHSDDRRKTQKFRLDDW